MLQYHDVAKFHLWDAIYTYKIKRMDKKSAESKFKY